MTTQAPTPAGHPRRWAILVAMSLTMFIATLDNTVMTVGLASIQRGLGASNADLQWAMDAYTLTFAALLFTAGLLGDRFGRRNILIIGLLLFTAASLAGAWSGSPGTLIAWRAAMGVGAAVIPGCTMAVIATVFPAEERAKAIGLWSTAAGVGIGAGPVFGGLLLDRFWWGSLLLVNVPFAVVAIVLIAMLVPENRNPAAPRLDYAGALLSISGVGSLVYGVIKGGEEKSWAETTVLAPIALGVLLIVCMLFVESRMKIRSFDPSLFKNKLFAIGAGVLAAAFFVGTGVTYIMSFYLQLLRNNSPVDAGLLMLPLAVGTVIAGLRAANWVAALGRATALGLSAFGMAVGCAAYAFFDAGTSIVLFEAVYFVFGLSFGAAFAVGMAATMSVIEPARLGAGSAVANMMRHMGTAFGVAVMGSVLGSVYRHSLTGPAVAGLPAAARTSLGSTMQALAKAPGDTVAALAKADSSYVSGMHAALWVGAGLCLVAACAAFVGLPKKAPKAVPAAAASSAPAAPPARSAAEPDPVRSSGAS